MKRRTLALAALAALVVSASATAAVPTTLGFTARLVDDKTDKALTGSHHITFELFDAETAGHSVWQEGRDVTVDDGLLFTDIGETKPLDGTVFNGRKLWLEVKLDDATMEPRIAMDSVPYAIHAGDADTLGGMTTEDVQTRITGSCGTGNFIIGVNADGTVVCAPDLSGSGDITAVTVGTGLMGGGSAGDVNIALTNTCAATEVLKWNGTAWNCAPDANSGGDITGISVAASSGLVGGGAAGDVALSLLTNCGMGQLLKWNGSAWACANDVDTDTDTNSGGDITDVVAGNGLVGGGSSGAVTVDVAVGTGLLVTANQVALDQAFTDTRYLNATGDTMSGALDMAQQRVLSRGCPGGYVRHGPGLCAEDADTNGLTFSGCANKCRLAGTHVCSSAEVRGIMQSGVTVNGGGMLFDWVDDQDVVNSAFFMNSATDPEAMAVRPTTSANFCRCCANVE